MGATTRLDLAQCLGCRTRNALFSRQAVPFEIDANPWSRIDPEHVPIPRPHIRQILRTDSPLNRHV